MYYDKKLQRTTHLYYPCLNLCGIENRQEILDCDSCFCLVLKIKNFQVNLRSKKYQKYSKYHIGIFIRR